MKPSPMTPRAGALLLLTCAASPTLSGCADRADDDSPSSPQPLYLAHAKWPTNSTGVHTVPVCFTRDSTQRPDFAAVRDRIHRVVNNTWGRRANLQFTEFGTCSTWGTPGAGKVRVTIIDSADPVKEGAVPSGGYQGSANPANVTFGAQGLQDGMIAHKFGHLLGFVHETARPDFRDDSSGGCRGPDISGGDTLGTPANDRYSIMAGWGTCYVNQNDLTPWDIIGLQNAYGRKLPGSLVGLDNRCLDVPGWQFVDGNKPTLYDCQGGANQAWSHGANDTLSVTGNGATKCLDLPGRSGADGTSPTLYTCHGETNQQWAFKGTWIVGLGGKCLQWVGTALEDGNPLQIAQCDPSNFHQTWTFKGSEIRNDSGGPFCIDASGGLVTNGAQLVLTRCDGRFGQQFALSPGGQLSVRPGGPLGIYNMCMDVAQENPADGTPVGIYDCGTNKLNQAWAASGPMESLGKCLSIPLASSFNGATPAIGHCNAHLRQEEQWVYYW